jgi:hypothetical protein
MYPLAKGQQWTALRCVFIKPTGKAFAVHSYAQLFAMGLPTFPRFLLLDVLGWCSYL